MSSMVCAHCGSGDTAALADRRVCYSCGKHTLTDGTAATKPGPQNSAELRLKIKDEVA